MIPQKEFEKLEFNPFVLKKNERMVNKYVKLQQIKGFKEAEDTLVRYIAVLYDVESPLQAKRLDERQKEAAKLVNLKKAEEIFSLEDENALELVTGFLIYKGNMTWHLLCSAGHAFYQYNKLIMSPGSKNKLKLLNDSDTLKDKIQDYYNSLFGDNEKVANKAKQLINKDYTPEGIASNV